MNELTSNKAVRLALVAVFALLALFLLVKTWDGAFGREAGDPYNTITVEGTGRATAVPDTARITFSVTESAANVADAQKQATEKIDAALKSVESLNVEEKDVKTLSYNVSPRYEYSQQAPCYPGTACPPIVSGNPKIVGYDVSQTVEVKVRDTSKAGDVLQALGSIGVQNISGPEFVVDDEDGVKAEARAEAIKNAQEKAKKLAKELGVHLGPIATFYENGPSYPMYDSYAGKGGSMMSAVAPEAPRLPVGEDESSVTVSITYEIR